MSTLKDEKIDVVLHVAVEQAVMALVESLRTSEKLPREAILQEIVISHPGNADSSLHYRTTQR